MVNQILKGEITMYFERIGKANTSETIKLALEAAHENNITNIVVASGTGETALCLVDAAKSGMILLR